MEYLSKIEFDASERKKKIAQELENVGMTNYYVQMFDKNCNIEVRIDLLLKFIGMSQGRAGFSYSKEAVKLVFYSENRYSTIVLYEEVAKRYSTNATVVERSIRRIKEKALINMKPDIKMLIFGNSNISRIRNTEFIYALVSFISSFEI